jgi:hypothetical protein
MVRGGGNVGIARAISKGGGKRRETWFWFSSFSTVRHFHGPFRFRHALRRWNLVNSFRLASCISAADRVSDFAAASCAS